MFSNKSHELATAALKEGEIDLAIELYTKALLESENDCDIISDRAVAYLHKNDKLRCFGDFNKALQMQPNKAYRYASRAYAKNHFGDLDGALEDYEKAVELDPDDAIAQNNLGLLLEQKGYQNQADERFKRADSLSEQEDGLLEVIDELENSEDVSVEGESPTTRPLNEVEEKKEESKPNSSEEFKKVFTSKSQFKEFINFVKNGFKIK